MLRKTPRFVSQKRIRKQFAKRDCRKTAGILSLESLEHRRVLASSTVGPAITGMVFKDDDNNLAYTAGEEIANATVQLYLDDGDGIFEQGTDDVQVGVDQLTDVNGEYCFDNLDGTASYFVFQPGQTIGSVSLAAMTSSLVTPGDVDLLIDSFETNQVVTATSPAPASDGSTLQLTDETEIIGRERDLFAALTSGAGEVDLRVNAFGLDVLQFDSSSGVVGQSVVTWDGIDNDSNPTPTMGLGGRDLTNGGVNTGLAFRLGIDPTGAGETVTVSLFQGGFGNVSTASGAIPVTDGTASGYLFIPFSDFVGPVTPDNVDAIQLEIGSGISSADGQIDVIGVIGPKQADFNNPAGSDLAVTKTNNLTSVVPGEQITYEIVVSNLGPANVIGANFTDDFTAQFTNPSYTSVVNSGTVTGNTASGTGNIDDTLDMTAGSSVTYTVTGTVAPNASGTLDNTAIVRPGNGMLDLDGTNNAATDSDPLVPTVDLTITKDDGVTEVDSGGSLTYQIVVTNNGPSDVVGATITDTFPTELDNVAYTSTTTGTVAGNTASGSGSISDTVDMTVGSTITYTVTADVLPSARTSVTNTATVSAPNGTVELDDTNNTATDIDTVNSPVDLQITKTDNVTNVVSGETLTYQIVVTNNGPSSVTGAVISDAFPAELTNVSYTSTTTGTVAGNTSSGTGSILDTVDMTVGSSITYTVTGTVTSSAQGDVTNTATVDPPNDTTETNVDNNSATDIDTIINQIDLEIVKSNSTDTVQAGGQVNYQIVVTNNGPSDAFNAQIDDALPANLTNVSYTSTTTGTVSGNTASGSGNISDTVDMTVGSTITYAVTATVVDGATGTIENTATVTPSSANIETDPDNNTSSETDTIPEIFDLAIVKTNGVTEVTPGETLTYQITVSNEGTAAVSGATVADSFPSSLTNVSFTSTTTGGASGNTASGSGNISDTVNLPVGSTIVYSVSGTVSPSATGQISNTATVASPTSVTETNLDNNSSTHIDTLTPEVDLVITKTDNVTTVVPGESVTYDIVVRNQGPSTVTGATVSDTFPATLTNVSFTSSVTGTASGNTSSGTGNISDTVTMAPGSEIRYTVTATVVSSATGTLVNTATVTAPNGVTETNSANNSSTDTDTLTPQVDLRITKTDNKTNVSPGDTSTYTIVVTNNGPSDAPGTRIQDTFPADLTNVSFTSTASGGATGNSSGNGSLNETVSMPSGSSITYTVTTTVVGDPDNDQISNTATVTAGSTVTETNTSNNTATDVDTIDLALASITGKVYLDNNRNGTFDSGDDPISGVEVILEQNGAEVDRVLTDANGNYLFDQLQPGTYTVSEVQPTAFLDGEEEVTGSIGAVAADDVFSVELQAGETATGLNFGESTRRISKRDLLASSFAS
ncbi:MAG: SdrD B-like domain-containing protein [Pirellulaceae bacterium]